MVHIALLAGRAWEWGYGAYTNSKVKPTASNPGFLFQVLLCSFLSKAAGQNPEQKARVQGYQQQTNYTHSLDFALASSVTTEK